MTYTTGSPLVLTGRPPSAEQLWAAFAPMTPAGETGRVRQALAVLAGVGAACRCDPVILAAIAWIETGEAGTGLPWRSRWWLGRNNAGNLGVTGDPAQDAASQRWQTPHDGAVALVAHYVAYAWGSRWRSAWDTDALGLPGMQDKRFQTVLEATGGVPVDTLGGLSGRWSTDMAYGDKLAERCNALMTAIAASATDPIVTTPATDPEPIETGEDAMSNVFGRVPHPPFIDLPVSKQYAGQGYTQIPAGSRKIVGVMNHETQGHGSGQWYRDFFSCPNGARCADALVDYLITRDGTIYRLNDPANDRSPWANGGPLGLEGDGPAFYARFGAAGVNNSLISIEHESLNNENWTDAQVRSSGLLNAYWHDQDAQDWESYPYVPRYGCVTSLAHFEIGTTDCGKGELDDITRVQAIARGEMKKWQTMDSGPSVPETPSVPDQPDTPTLPGGADPAKAAKAFGTLVKHMPDGKTKDAPFDPRGVISLSYTHRCIGEFGLNYDQWPEAEDWWALSDSGKTLDIVTFSNEWQLIRTAERQGIMWAVFADAELMDEAA